MKIIIKNYKCLLKKKKKKKGDFIDKKRLKKHTFIYFSKHD